MINCNLLLANYINATSYTMLEGKNKSNTKIRKERVKINKQIKK